MARLLGTWRGRAALLAALLIAAGTVALALRDASPAVRGLATAAADPVPYDGRSPREPGGDEQRVLLELGRPALGRVRGVTAMDAGDRRAYVASLEREAQALRGALDARGVRLTDVVSFERAWNGFAATVRSRDLPAIASLGVRAQPVRRFYPAVSQPAATAPARDAPPAAAPAGQAAVALLASGVAGTVAPLRGRVDDGHDALDRDADPAAGADPRDARRREASGTALAGVLAAAGERVHPIRVAGLRAGAGGGQAEEYATTDTLLAGLERAVDPDGDGDTSDALGVALVGVSAPYAGFADAPESEAVAGAEGLGTLVVAPAGQEGPGRGSAGTIGSPGAAPSALTVGALATAATPVARTAGAPAAGGAPVARAAGAPAAAAMPVATLTAGDVRVPRAAILAGTPSTAALRASRPVTSSEPAELLRSGGPRVQGALAVVRAGAQPAAQVAAAAAAGARAVLLAEPRAGRALTAMPAGRVGVPVLGVTGDAARALLALPADTRVRFGPARAGASAGAGMGSARTGTATPSAARPRPRPGAGMAVASSRGPTAAGGPKPDLAAPGAATTIDVSGRPALAGGTAVAAALAAAEAAARLRADPGLSPRALRAALTGDADPGGGETPELGPEAAGAGALRPPPAGPRITATAPEATDGRISFRVESSGAVDLGLTATTGATVSPAALRLRPGRPRAVTVRLPAAAAAAGSTGRVTASDAAGRLALSVPFALAPDPPAPVRVGPLALRRRGGRVVGVSFTLGAFERGDPPSAGTLVGSAERLDLELVRPDGSRVRALTPSNGARGLLPAEYAYTLPARALREIDAGRLAFRARARAPGQVEPSERRSRSFRVQ